MAEGKAEKKPGKNFYKEAARDPETLRKRAQRKAQLDAAAKDILDRMPGRVPDWDRERVMQMDRFCLENGKRCVMWDDQKAGFFLMLNWDWIANRPAVPASDEERWEREQGWWHIIKPMLKAPLIANDLPDEEMAAWIDKHTMRIHGAFLDKLDRLRLEGEGKGARLVLDDPYWAELQALEPWLPAPRPTPRRKPWEEELCPAPEKDDTEAAAEPQCASSAAQDAA